MRKFGYAVGSWKLQLSNFQNRKFQKRLTCSKILLLGSCSQCFLALTLSWRGPLSYRNQSIDLQSKSMDWFLFDNGLRHERVIFSFSSILRFSINAWNILIWPLQIENSTTWLYQYRWGLFYRIAFFKKVLVAW